jgi:polyhydroxyalkanoate synthesis regulator phasin
VGRTEKVRRYVGAGISLAEAARAQAEAVVKSLAKAGDSQRGQAQSRVNDLVVRGRDGAGMVVERVRREISRQLSAVGLATKEDIHRLEARIPAASEPAPGNAPGAPLVVPQEPPAQISKPPSPSSVEEPATGASRPPGRPEA